MAAVKEVYKIPDDLNKTKLDREVSLKTKDGLGFDAITSRVILYWVFSILVLIWMLFKSFMNEAGMINKIIFAALWLILTYNMFKYTPYKEMQMDMIVSFFDYLPRNSRHVVTRRDKKATEFVKILGIRDIDQATGMVIFTDGTFGYFYKVVGSASRLLFDQDRDAILERVSAFYEKIQTGCEYITFTTKESQKVYEQMANLQERYDNLKVRDPDLLDLLEEQFEVFKYYVGDSFKSIHQYMVLKSDSLDDLEAANNILRSEVMSSTKMIKKCEHLYEDDIIDTLQKIYR